MRNTRIQNVRTQSPASMSPTRSHTVSGAMQSEDDDEACPSCDGHCTCRRQKRHQTIPDYISISKIDQDTNEHSIGSPPSPLKKKRGRPPKAVVEARIAAAKAAQAALGASHSRSRLQRKVQRPVPLERRASAPNQRKKLILPVKPKPTRSKPKGNPKKPVRRVVETSSESDIDFLDDDSDSVLGEFPTFVSAESSSSTDDDSDSSLSSGMDSGDEEMRKEEEMLIVTEEQRKARVKRELLREDGGGRVPQKQWNRHQWESKPKRKSVSSDVGGSTDVITDSDEEENEEEDGEAEDEAEPDQFRDEGEFEFSSQSDDELDANLFFANLEESSADEDSAIDGDRSSAGNGPEDCDLDAFTFPKALQGVSHGGAEKAVGLLVTEDWNGQLVLGSGHRVGLGVLDLDFEMNAAKHKHNTHPRRGRSGRRKSNDSTDDEVIGSQSDDETQAEGDDESLYVDSDAGSTTDDDFIDQGPIRFPTPPSTAVDPMSTVSSPFIAPRKAKATGSSSNGKIPQSSSFVTPSSSRPSTSNGLPLEPLKPADILSGSARNSPLVPRGPRLGSFPITSPVFVPWSTATPPPSTPGSTVSCLSTPSARILDRAMTPTPISTASQPNQALCAIIDNTTIAIPSPFPKIKRVRRQRSGIESSPGWSRERKRSADSSDISPYFSKRRRQSSVAGSVRSPLSHEEELSSSLELPPATAEFIDLDDVLDSSFLDDDSMSQAASSFSNSIGTPALDYFNNRWDRVPMSTFRQTRAPGGVGGVVSQDETGLNLAERSFKLGPRAAPDGFSYGSTAGAVLRKTPYPLPGLVSSLGAPFPLVGSLWTSGNETPNGKRNRDRPLSSMLSPGGRLDHVRDRTPTQEYHAHPGIAGGSKGNMKSPNRRKKDRTAR